MIAPSFDESRAMAVRGLVGALDQLPRIILNLIHSEESSMATKHARQSNAWIAERDPLHVVAFADPLVDQLGHDVRSDYVETYWLPVLGPSAVWAARRLADWLDPSPDGLEVPLESLGRSLGLGGGVANHSPVVRTLARLIDFDLAVTDGTSYAIRRDFPQLRHYQLRRLPDYLVRSHPTVLEPAR